MLRDDKYELLQLILIRRVAGIRKAGRKRKSWLRSKSGLKSQMPPDCLSPEIGINMLIADSVIGEVLQEKYEIYCYF